MDIAYECTELFTTREKAALHLQNGYGRVFITAPGTDVDRTVVFGVNHTDLTANDVIVSNAHCTTNCFAPVAMVFDEAFGIKTGYMATIHSFTVTSRHTTPTTVTSNRSASPAKQTRRNEKAEHNGTEQDIEKRNGPNCRSQRPNASDLSGSNARSTGQWPGAGASFL